MIERINTASVNKPLQNSPNEPQFRGGPLDVALSALQMCEANPMLNVAVLDLSTAIVPRTIVEGETNPYAGFEAFRRESSGLIVNCMIPSIIVLGIAHAIQNPIIGGSTNMGSCWANGDTINLVTKYWQNAKDTPVKQNGKVLYKGEKAKVYNTIKNILKDTEGVDGNDFKNFKDMNFDEGISKLTEQVYAQKYSKAEVKSAYKAIVDKTHISENIKIKGHGEGFYSENLGSVLRDTPKILKEIVSGKVPDPASFAVKARRLVNTKSLLGLGVILPLAVSMQPINRWITAKTSGVEGAPIYKDFGKNSSKNLTPKEKSDLLKQKFISIGSMIAVALLSMGGKLPTMNVLQFKGIFPTMDQARIISTATFSSRMAASEDRNDLREATVRDIATFSSFYFLGDYVAKGIASWIQKSRPDIKLINVLKAPDKNANPVKKFFHWAKHTALKSSDEVVGETAKKMRSLCQLGNIGFSLLALGILIPKLYRGKTDQEREKELKNMGIAQTIIDKYYPNFSMNTDKKVYESFTSNS